MDAVEEIKSRLSIEDVVSEYVQLKRAGRNWKGISPFTSEKTPSFTVSPEKQIWHDFSSGQGGDMFSFVQAMEGVDFKGSLDILARRAGIDLAHYQPKGSGGGPDKERLYAINELSTKFYQTQLSGSKMAIDYVFKTRQFTKETALNWRLGYAPNTGRAVVEFLKKQGYNQAEITLAGLTNRFGGDMFRERLMIPLADAQGRVVGFTARQLGPADADSPKYINTPGTPLYDKSRHVYGLHLAKETIRKSKFAVLAEGNLDVIMSHQAGVEQVVATAGTALTEPHLTTLGRLTGDIRLCFDADKAGLNATERAIPIASRTKVNLSIISIPSGKDPDELIKQDVAKWQEIIQHPKYALDWLMERYEQLLDITSAEGKRKYSDVLLPVVKGLNDPVEQDHYLVAIAKATGVSVQALQTKMTTGKDMNEQRTLKRHQAAQVTADQKPDINYQKNLNNLLSLVLLQKNLRPRLTALPLAIFPEGYSRQLVEFLLAHPDFDGASDPRAKQLNDLSEYVKILGLQYEETYEGVDGADLPRAAATLEQKIVNAYAEKRTAEINQQLSDDNDERDRPLLREIDQLNKLRNTYKGAH